MIQVGLHSVSVGLCLPVIPSNQFHIAYIYIYINYSYVGSLDYLSKRNIWHPCQRIKSTHGGKKMVSCDYLFFFRMNSCCQWLERSMLSWGPSTKGEVSKGLPLAFQELQKKIKRQLSPTIAERFGCTKNATFRIMLFMSTLCSLMIMMIAYMEHLSLSLSHLGMSLLAVMNA